MDVSDRLGYLGVSGRIVLDVRPNTLAMEGMQARVHKELTIVKYRAEADVTVLRWVDRDVLVLLVTPLGT